VKKLIILISGNGSNLQAIIDATVSKKLNAAIALVVSNKSDAYGLERARKANIQILVKEKKTEQTRENYDRELAEIIKQEQPDFIILAGWMRLLSNHFLKHFSNQVINLHPALPHTFPGINSITRAFEAYQRNEIKQTGIMIHFVPDEGIDDGPVIATEIVPIFPEDNLEIFTQRMHHAEHQLLVETLKKLMD